ncbi:hypothetical protein [Kitasatospora phosalacinea]|uniref:hypothetical protein n=1 Tax=Kitasatospora phosalacinea TaxID=2065 RepID=UPI0005265C47|nr:hypothetical protein [Kitasatospora phosalacinea]
MLHGELPLDLRPLHVHLEHKQRLSAALELLAARAATGHGPTGSAFTPSPAAFRRAAELRERAAELRSALPRRTPPGATPQAADAWLHRAGLVLEQERLLHHVLCRETAPNRRVGVPVRRPDRPPRSTDQ